MSDQLRKKFNELNLIADLGTKLTTILEVDELAGTIVDSIKENLDFNRGSILLVDNKTQRVFYDRSFGFDGKEIEQLRNLAFSPNTAHNQNPILKAYASQKPVLINNYSNNHAHDLFQRLNAQAIICISINYERTPLGVLLLTKTFPDGLIQSGDIEVLTGIAAQTAVSLTNIDSFQKVQESEDRFRKVFEYSAGGIILIYPDGRLLKFNSFFSEMLGYSKEELLSKPYSEIIHAKDLGQNLVSLKRLINGEINADSFETRYLHKNGNDVWAFVSISMLRDKSGNPSYFISLVQDLSAKKEAQKENQILEAQLQQSQKMEAIGTLAGGIAHDFNNILSAISGYTELSMMNAYEDEELNTYLKNIYDASQRAAELVKQILMISRRGKSEMKPLMISSVTKEAIKLLRATLPPNIEITQNISNEAGSVLADPNQIHQVVMNLCTNAYHAILEKGSGSLHVDLSFEENLPKDLKFPDDKQSNKSKPTSCMKLSISDTGCGMNPDTVKRIFEPYFTTKEKGKGTGLGLSVVHGIIKNHGGVINVRSVPGEGTRFDIFLAKTDQKETQAIQTAKEMPTGSERVLIIDDELDITKICETMLTRLGYTVTCKNEPIDALEEFRANPDLYDLVITDMAMPKMMGNELAEEMLRIRSDIPIIYSTGYNELINNKPNAKPSFNNYLKKPIYFEKLADIVRHTIDQSISN
jgi:PAS domain S-box-containing protein